MREEIYYCDYCKQRCHNLFNINTKWERISFFLIIFQGEIKSIKGEACKDCYNSFKRWVKSRNIKSEEK